MISSFEQIVVPHTNISLPWHSFDDKAYEFVSTYRRRFKTPPNAKGKRVFRRLRGRDNGLDSVDQWGFVGEYKGGFTPFSFELTEHLKLDGENVLVVEVDSTERNDIPPFGNEIDYMTFGVSTVRSPCGWSLPCISRQYPCEADGRIERQAGAGCGLLSGRQAVGGGRLSVEIELRDGEHVVGKTSKRVSS